ncbi:DUF6439 family protein [cf. Phormidesmis sp. LEGE 11477]|uniref:DUF6439 family protein n=1 Tax=cf. Phormidesmis sp. LEGE 11477 TaxID=1828680 RepID=UPI00351CE8A9
MTTSSHSSNRSTHQAPAQAPKRATDQATVKKTTEATTKAAVDKALTHRESIRESRALLQSFSAEALAQALAEKLAVSNHDWHRLSANRNIRAREQAAAAIVYMLKDMPEEALPRLTQAVGWLDKTLKAPPCPTHGERKRTASSMPTAASSMPTTDSEPTPQTTAATTAQFASKKEPG